MATFSGFMGVGDPSDWPLGLGELQVSFKFGANFPITIEPTQPKEPGRIPSLDTSNGGQYVTTTFTYYRSRNPGRTPNPTVSWNELNCSCIPMHIGLLA